MKTFNYEEGEGSEVFYDYFYNKIGIGADPTQPFTKFLELIIDFYYNNCEDITKLLYDGVLNENTAANLDESLRNVWLDKLGKNNNAPNKYGLLEYYKIYSFLNNNEYNQYMYLKNCRLRTVEDWKTQFNQCFLSDKNTDITERIEYKDENLFLNYSEYDTLEEKWFMTLLFKRLMDYNCIFNKYYRYYEVLNESFDKVLPTHEGPDGLIIIGENDEWCGRNTILTYDRTSHSNNIKFGGRSGGNIFNYSMLFFKHDFQIEFMINPKYPRNMKIALMTDDQEIAYSKLFNYLNIEENKWNKVKIVRENEVLTINVNDEDVEEITLDTQHLYFGITSTAINNQFNIKNFEGYNIPIFFNPSSFKFLVNIENPYVLAEDHIIVNTKLTNAEGQGIPDYDVTITSSNGDTITKTTPSSGELTFTLNTITKNTEYVVDCEILQKKFVGHFCRFTDYAVEGKHNHRYFTDPSTGIILEENETCKIWKTTEAGNGGAVFLNSTSYSDRFDGGNSWIFAFKNAKLTGGNAKFGVYTGAANVEFTKQELGLNNEFTYNLRFKCDGTNVMAYVNDELKAKKTFPASEHSYLYFDIRHTSVNDVTFTYDLAYIE